VWTAVSELMLVGCQSILSSRRVMHVISAMPSPHAHFHNSHCSDLEHTPRTQSSRAPCPTGSIDRPSTTSIETTFGVHAPRR